MSPPASSSTPRPLGIFILSILHFVGGVAFLAMGVAFPFLASDKPEAKNLTAVFAQAEIIAGILFLAVLAIGSGVGMWIGAKWGWGFGVFYYACGVIRSLFALLGAYLLFDKLPAEEIADMAREPGYYYFKYGGRAVVHALVMMYFFKGSVLDYFGFEEVPILGKPRRASDARVDHYSDLLDDPES